ncbi:MAG: VWA domain-containing protein [Eubacterium sp.]|nr:VWA domain-containing protein [Eubacterium sp.]
MGSGVWREDSFRFYSKRVGRTVDSSGRLAGNMSNQEMFAARTLDPILDPKDVLRECCDSKEHPNTVPVILALDVTGSMGQAAVEVAKELNIIMTKLYNKVKDVEFMIMGIGDFAYDRYPLQVSQFESDIRIAEQLDKVYFEFGGGGNGFESYTAAWYFGLNHIRLDAWNRGKKGLVITMGDEGFNPYLPAARVAEVMGRPVDEDIDSMALYGVALQKYDIFHLFVNHGYYRNEGYINSWKSVLDGEHFKVVKIENICDTIVDIVKTHAGKAAENNDKIIFPKAVGISW